MKEPWEQLEDKWMSQRLWKNLQNLARTREMKNQKQREIDKSEWNTKKQQMKERKAKLQIIRLTVKQISMLVNVKLTFCLLHVNFNHFTNNT